MDVTANTRLWKYGRATLGFATFVLLCSGTLRAQARYTVTDLGTLGVGWKFAIGHAIDDSGQVSGYAAVHSDGSGVSHAFFRPQGATKNRDLGTLGGTKCSPVPCSSDSSFRSWSDTTQVAGGSSTGVTDPSGLNLFGDGYIAHAYLWQKGAMKPIDLGTLGGLDSYANGINARGQVVGWANTPEPDPPCTELGLPFQKAPPALWEHGKARALPTLPGDLDGFALSINDEGDAVGFSTPSFCSSPYPFITRAVRWHNGRVRLLGSGSLGGTMGNWALSSNDLGQVVGFSDLAGDTPPSPAISHAFLWEGDDDDGAPMIDLGTLPGDTSSFAPGINNKGQVVGGSCTATGCRAFLWEDGKMTDLNTLIPRHSPLYLLQAIAINNRGQIVGAGCQRIGKPPNCRHSSETHAFLLNPVDDDVPDASATLAVPGEAIRVSSPNDVQKRLLDLPVPGPRRFRFGEGGDSLSGSFTNQFVNLGGQVVFAGSGTFTGRRLAIEPLMP